MNATVPAPLPPNRRALDAAACPECGGYDADECPWCDPRRATATKRDHGKRRWSLVPWAALGDAVDVLTAGAAEHGDFGWRDLPNARERYFDALLRHLTAWCDGERINRDSGRAHLAHALANAIILAALDREVDA